MNAAWKTIRVFISSTFRDMQAERDWLVRFVFPRLKERLLKYRIHFVDVDLRWGVTGDEDAGEVCREVIGECRPRFIGMLGGRYGWVPPPKRIAQGDFNALLLGTTRAGPLTEPQREAFQALYSRSESGGEFRLHEKPEAAETRKLYDAHCQLILTVLQCAGLATSITADEIDFGVLNPPPDERGPVRAFFYFRDEAVTKRMVEEKPGDFREPDGSDSARDLAALKQTIVDGGLPVFVYDAQWDSAAKRLTGLKRFGNRVLCDLFQSIRTDPELAARFTSKGDAETDPIVRECQDEAEQMEAFIQERTDSYILGSREPLMNDLLALASTDGAPNILVLTGEPGSGKSALLAKFTRKLEALHPSSFILPTFIGASTGSTDLRRTLRRLCHGLANASGNTEPLPLDIKELITHFQKLLNEAAQETVRTTRRIILVFDALNQFDETDGAHWMNWLPRDLPPGVRIIASVIAPLEGGKEHQTLAILGNRKDTEVLPLAALKWQDTVRIIRGYLKRYSKRMSKSQKRALLKKPASNLPLYILTALEELRTLGTNERLCELATKPLFPPEELERLRREDHDAILARFIDVELPDTAVELFKWILQTRLAKDPILASHPKGAPQLIEQFAACLGVSRRGLSPAELTALLDPGDPLGNVAALLSLLRPYLMRRGELLDFYHGQFREAVGAAHLDTPEKQRAAHQSVATCLQAFADPHRDGHCREATPHALSELPHHQTRAEAWPELIATLENIFFLEAKVTHGMTFDLAEDFVDAVESLPNEHANRERVAILYEALIRDIRFIARHSKDYPQALFQCLWNSAWWFDCPEAAQHYDPSPPVPKSILERIRHNFVGVKERPRSLAHWNHLGPKLHSLLDRWREQKENSQPSVVWLRSLRPPEIHLGTAQRLVLSQPDVGSRKGNSGGFRMCLSIVSFSPDGQRIASGLSAGWVRIIDAFNGKELNLFEGIEGALTSVDFSPDGALLVTGSSDGVRIWNTRSGGERRISDKAVECVSFSPNGLLVAGGAPTEICIWETDSGRELAALNWALPSSSSPEPFRFGPPKGSLSCLCFLPDGHQFASGHSDGKVRIWNTGDYRESAVVEHLSGVQAISFSADGIHIATSCSDKVFVRDVKTGSILTILSVKAEYALGNCFSPDGRLLASGGSDGTVRIWEVQSGRQMKVLRGHKRLETAIQDKDELKNNWVYGVRFAPHGYHLVSAGSDGTVRVWDLSCGGMDLITLPDHTKPILTSVFSPDGRCLASGSYDESVRVWSAESGQVIAIFQGDVGPIERVVFSFDSCHVIAVASNGYRLVWRIADGKCVKLSPMEAGRLPRPGYPSNPSIHPETRLGETIFRPISSNEPIAYLDASFRLIYAGVAEYQVLATEAEGCVWAGADGSHLTIVRLERV